VIELSSFQLERGRRLRLFVSVIINITPDVTWTGTTRWRIIVAAKANIFRNQTADDFAVPERRR